MEGYLFPETYCLSGEETARDIIVKMLDQFNKVYHEQLQQAVENSGYTLDQIVTIASIIESEIRAPQERPVASGVIYNRLEAGMRLQMDATVPYAQGLRKEVVTQEDLEAVSYTHLDVYKRQMMG